MVRVQIPPLLSRVLSRLSLVRVTVGYAAMLIVVATTLLILGPRVEDAVVSHMSTNVHNLARGHFATLVGSCHWDRFSRSGHYVGIDVRLANGRVAGAEGGLTWVYGNNRRGRDVMDVRLLGFGSIQVEGRAYEHDIVIDRGAVRKRSKKPSRPYRDKFGHTPLSADEELPWGGPRLIIGTGAHGSLPIMPEVAAEAARRNIDLVAVPTEQACRLIAGLKKREVRAVLHVTC
ncbi:MAG TPA: MTH938/NDUFAF3 family protein [Mycobacterium sp.]|nr:MTH938/NDUFAF3 family protein [Mycobacterium sp.]